MDDIEKAKIGKRDEKLVGWDYIRQRKLGTNYPPMRAKGALLTPGAIRIKGNASYQGNSASSGSGWFWFVVIVVVIVVAIVGAKVIGLW